MCPLVSRYGGLVDLSWKLPGLGLVPHLHPAHPPLSLSLSLSHTHTRPRSAPFTLSQINHPPNCTQTLFPVPDLHSLFSLYNGDIPRCMTSYFSPLQLVTTNHASIYPARDIICLLFHSQRSIKQRDHRCPTPPDPRDRLIPHHHHGRDTRPAPQRPRRNSRRGQHQARSRQDERGVPSPREECGRPAEKRRDEGSADNVSVSIAWDVSVQWRYEEMSPGANLVVTARLPPRPRATGTVASIRARPWPIARRRSGARRHTLAHTAAVAVLHPIPPSSPRRSSVDTLQPRLLSPWTAR